MLKHLSEITRLATEAQDLAEVDGSLRDTANRIEEAFHAGFSPDDIWESQYRTLDVFEGHPLLDNSIIVLDKKAGVKLQAVYTDTGEAVEFAPRAEWQPVELTYQFVSATAEADLLRGETPADELSESADFALPVSVLGIAENETGDGLTYLDVLPIGPGWGNKKNNHYYSPELVAEIAPMWEGAKQYATDHRESEKSVLTEVSEIVKSPAGFTEGVKGVPDGTPYARAVILREDFAEIVINRAKAGILENLHCSILASGTARKGFELDGRKGKLVESITQVHAVDWVRKAGARGRALAIAESEEETMSDKKELKQKEPTQAAEAELVTISEEDAASIIDAAATLPDVSRTHLKERTYATAAEVAQAVEDHIAYVKELTGGGEPVGQNAQAPPEPVQEDRTAALEESLTQIEQQFGLIVPQGG